MSLNVNNERCTVHTVSIFNDILFFLCVKRLHSCCSIWPRYMVLSSMYSLLDIIFMQESEYQNSMYKVYMHQQIFVCTGHTCRFIYIYICSQCIHKQLCLGVSILKVVEEKHDQNACNLQNQWIPTQMKDCTKKLERTLICSTLT